jgi:hypothetical protein
MSDQDYAQTLRRAADSYRLSMKESGDRASLDRAIDALEAGAAALVRTCGTCRYGGRPLNAMRCMNAGSPVYNHDVPADFGCTLHQPQEPPT